MSYLDVDPCFWIERIRHAESLLCAPLDIYVCYGNRLFCCGLNGPLMLLFLSGMVMFFGAVFFHRQRQHPSAYLRRKQEFLQRHGSQYGYVDAPIDQWRCQELPGLIPSAGGKRSKDDQAMVYLDYAGAALPVQSQLEKVFRSAYMAGVWANPHSQGGPASDRTQALIEQTKTMILDHFGAKPQCITSQQNGSTQRRDDTKHNGHPGYDILFTSGATQALQIVAERFFAPKTGPACPHCDNSSSSPLLVYPQECHTSVLGMRQAVLPSQFYCRPMNMLLDEQHDHEWMTTTNEPLCSHCSSDTQKLLAVPLECNFTGKQYDVKRLFRRVHGKTKTWYTVLDMAKAAATAPIHLNDLNPDFACVSFYKLFGEPTGLGCLFVKRTSVHALTMQNQKKTSLQHRHFFGGGAVDVVLSARDFVVPRAQLAGLQQGTVHFRGIAALQHGFAELARVGGMKAIQQHTHCLAQELFRRLKALRHAHNGRCAIQVYGDCWESPHDVRQSFGPTVTFNVIRANGAYVGYHEVSKLAALYSPPIQLRTGCFCNPGACQLALGISDETLLRNYRESGHVCGDAVDIINGQPTGAVRASFGKDSTWEDLDSLVVFLDQIFVQKEGNNCSETTKETFSEDILPESNIAHITELYIYPIKSCSAQRVRCWEVDPQSGKLAFDREFALVDSSGRALRLQSYPKMNHLKPEILPQQRKLRVHAPHQASLLIDIDRSYDTNRETVRVCGESCNGAILGDSPTSEWFSKFLGVRCWLARHVKEDNYPPRIPRGVRDRGVAFANERPLLLVSGHSVDLLNGILRSQGQQPIKSLHFRPNIVVRVAGHNSLHNVEDKWKRLVRINDCGDLELDVVGQCARCSMVDFHPDNGERGKTMKALAGYRRANGQINFGIFLHTSSARNELCTFLREDDEFLCSS